MNSFTRPQQIFKQPPVRAGDLPKITDQRAESPKPKRVSAFKPFSTNPRSAKDKSPFRRFMEEELEPLPYPAIKINKPYEPSLTIYRTPDRPQNYAFLSISDRIDFDMLTSPMSKRKDCNEYSERYSYREEDDEDMEQYESEENQESSYVTPEQNPPPEEKKTPIKLEAAMSHHETRYRNREHHEESAQRSQHSQFTQNICCNCKKSRCLKLYCDCFRSNQVCQGCNCVSCLNTNDHHEERYSAMLAILEINEEAFKPKILVEKHAKGCNCKKSNCLKKYCECYQAGLKCSELCKCEDCKNAKMKESRDLPKNRNRTTVKKEARYDSHTKKLLS